MVKREKAGRKKKSKGMPIDCVLALIVGVGMPLLWVYATYTGAMAEPTRQYFGVFALFTLILSFFYIGTRQEKMVKKRSGLLGKMGKWAKTGMIFGGGIGFVRAFSSAKMVIDGGGAVHPFILMGLIVLAVVTTFFMWVIIGAVIGHGVDLGVKKW